MKYLSFNDGDLYVMIYEVLPIQLGSIFHPLYTLNDKGFFFIVHLVLPGMVAFLGAITAKWPWIRGGSEGDQPN